MPKTLPEKPDQSIVMLLFPILAALVLTIVIRGMMGNGGYFIIYFVAMMCVSGIMSIWNYIHGKNKYKNKIVQREVKYQEYIAAKEEEIRKYRDKEVLIANKMNASLEECIHFVEDFDSRLFEKKTDHEDFLDISIGRGTKESVCQVEYKEQEYVETEDELMGYPAMLHDQYKYLQNMPVNLPIHQVNAIGFVGSRTKLYQMAKNIILSVSIQHF